MTQKWRTNFQLQVPQPNKTKLISNNLYPFEPCFHNSSGVGDWIFETKWNTKCPAQALTSFNCVQTTMIRYCLLMMAAFASRISRVGRSLRRETQGIRVVELNGISVVYPLLFAFAEWNLTQTYINRPVCYMDVNGHLFSTTHLDRSEWVQEISWFNRLGFVKWSTFAGCWPIEKMTVVN